GACTCVYFFFSSRRRHTRSKRDWSSDVCSSDLECGVKLLLVPMHPRDARRRLDVARVEAHREPQLLERLVEQSDVQVDAAQPVEIGRASCRERVELWVGGRLVEGK